MADIRLSRRELADLIRDGTLLSHCPKCAAELYLRLADLGGTAADRPEGGAKAAGKKEPWESPKCVSCSKPITAYAFAVRKGLCTECFAVLGGRLDKPGKPPEPPPETAGRPEPSPGPPP